MTLSNDGQQSVVGAGEHAAAIHPAVALADVLSEAWRECCLYANAHRRRESVYSAGADTSTHDEIEESARQGAIVAIEAALIAVGSVDPTLTPVKGPSVIEVAAELKPVLTEVGSELGALGQPTETQLRTISTAQASLRTMLFVEATPAPSARTCTSMLIELVGLVRRQRETDPRITGAPWLPPPPSEPRRAWQVGHDKVEEMLRSLEQQCQEISAKRGPFAQDPLSRVVARLRASFAEWRMAWALCDSADTSSLNDRIEAVEANWVSLAGEFASHEVPHFDPATEEATKDSFNSLAVSADVLLLARVRPEAAERLWQRALRHRQARPYLPSLPPGTGDPKQIVLSLKDWVVSAQGAEWERRQERTRRDSEKTKATPTASAITDLREIAETLRAMMGVPRTHSVYETAGSLLINATQQGALDGLPEAAKLIRVYAARPGGQNFVGAWSDGLFEIRQQRGLGKSVFSESFAEDAALVADIIEAKISSSAAVDSAAVGRRPSSFKRPIPIAKFSAQLGGGRSDYLIEKLRRAEKPVKKVGGGLCAELEDLLEFAGKHKRTMREWANKNYPADEEPLQ
ncbi:MAG: hypothetical protein AB7O77_17345 [Phycisphaerales bacterium]